MRNRNFWTGMKNFIFFTTTDGGWEENWDVLMFNDEPVTNMEEAKSLVRCHMNNQMVGLAEYNQMKLNNAQWDNI